MNLSIQEKKILYAFACPNHHNTVTRLKWLTALTVDPKAKRWMLGLARKMEMRLRNTGILALSAAPHGDGKVLRGKEVSADGREKH